MVERLAGKLERGQRVVDGRRLAVAGDRVDLGLVRRERRVEDRPEIIVADAREIRQAERPLPDGQRMGGEVDGF